MTDTDDTRMPEHPTEADPHYRELVETSIRLRNARHLLDAVLDLHAMVDSFTTHYFMPLCDACGEVDWPCETVLAATPAAEHAALHAKANEHAATKKAEAERKRAIINRVQSGRGLLVQTVADIEDVKFAIRQTSTIGDRITWSPAQPMRYEVRRG